MTAKKKHLHHSAGKKSFRQKHIDSTTNNQENLPTNTNSRLYKHHFFSPPLAKKHNNISLSLLPMEKSECCLRAEQSRAEWESEGKTEWEREARQRDETGEKHNLPAVVADAAARLCLLRCSCHQRLISHLYCQPLIGCCLGCSFHFDSLNCCLLSLWPTPASSWFKT